MSTKMKQTAGVLASGLFAVVAVGDVSSGEREAAMPGPDDAAPVEVVVERAAPGALEAPVRLTGEGKVIR